MALTLKQRLFVEAYFGPGPMATLRKPPAWLVPGAMKRRLAQVGQRTSENLRIGGRRGTTEGSYGAMDADEVPRGTRGSGAVWDFEHRACRGSKSGPLRSGDSIMACWDSPFRDLPEGFRRADAALP